MHAEWRFRLLCVFTPLNVCAVRDLLGGVSFVSLAGPRFVDKTAITRRLYVNKSVYVFRILLKKT